MCATADHVWVVALCDMGEPAGSLARVCTGQFALHDLVSLDARNVGCITRIERNRLFLLDQQGQQRDVRPQQVERRKQHQRPTALDADQNEITKDVRVDSDPFRSSFVFFWNLTCST
jgi:transcription elongation factor